MRSKVLSVTECAGDGGDQHVGVAQQALDALADVGGDGVGGLEGETARHADGDIGEVAAAGFANADAIDSGDAGHLADLGDDLIAHAGGSSWSRASSVSRRATS